MFMRRRPLFRAAAVGGGAYALGTRNARRQGQEADQNERIDDLESQHPPASAPAASGGISEAAVDRLAELGKLRDQGVLTDEEFSDAKQKVLAG